MTFKRYGALSWMSAALTVTGLLWWQSPNLTFRGEHMAAVDAMLLERLAAYTDGTSTVAYAVIPPTVETTGPRVGITYPLATVFGSGGGQADKLGRTTIDAGFASIFVKLTMLRQLATDTDAAGVQTPLSLPFPSGQPYGSATLEPITNLFSRYRSGYNLYGRVFWLDPRMDPLADGYVISVQRNGIRPVATNVYYITSSGGTPPDDFVAFPERIWAPAFPVNEYLSAVSMWLGFTNVEERVLTTASRCAASKPAYIPTVTSNYLPVAESVWNYLALTNTPATAPVFSALPAWWDYIGLATNPCYALPIEQRDPVTHAFLRWDTRRRKEILNTARFMAEGMKTSICIIPVNELGGVWSETYYEATDSFSYRTPEDTIPSWTAPVTLLQALPTPTAKTPVPDGWGLGDSLFCRASAIYYTDYYSRWYADGGETESDNPNRSYSGDGFAQLAIRQLTAQLPYPHEYWYRSNYIARVRVFAVPIYLPVRDVSVYAPLDTAYDITTSYGLSETGIQGGLVPLLPCFSHYASLDAAMDAQLAVDVNGLDTFVPTTLSDSLHGIGAVTELKLAQLGDWSNPTTQPTITIGTNIAIQLPPEGVSVCSATWDAQEYNEFTGIRWHYKHGSAAYQADVICPVIIVEVEWNFKHGNPTSPFEIDPSMPEWAQ